MTEVLLTVDPGARGCGCAFWTRDAALPGRKPALWTLFRALYATPYIGKPPTGETCPADWRLVTESVAHEANKVAWDIGAALNGRLPSVGATSQYLPTHLVIETMQVYTRSKGDPNDLLVLAAVGGYLFGTFEATENIGYKPREWKGQVPRGVLGRNTERKLQASGEWAKVVVPSVAEKLNDVMHGVALGWYVNDLLRGQQATR